MIKIVFKPIKSEKALMGEPQYLLSDHSFIYEPWLNPDYSIMIGSAYISIDMDISTNKALHISGYNAMDTWIKKDIVCPKSVSGNIMVYIDSPLSGSGEYYAENWNTYYDLNTGWICIGDLTGLNDDSTQSIEFAKNTIATIKDEQLISLWLRPKIIE